MASSLLALSQKARHSPRSRWAARHLAAARAAVCDIVDTSAGANPKRRAILGVRNIVTPRRIGSVGLASTHATAKAPAGK